jgi:hypothetical protein
MSNGEVSEESVYAGDDDPIDVDPASLPSWFPNLYAMVAAGDFETWLANVGINPDAAEDGAGG